MNNLQALTLDSREVAKMLPKRHADLLRDIATYSKYLADFNERNFALVDFFQESSYQDSKGENRKCYLITKKGCEFIAHKMTGRKGALFTATYINRFHEMEESLKQKTTAPVPVFQKYTYEGTILMPAMHLMAMTKVANSTFLLIAKRFQLPYVSLQGEKLAAFKQENRLVHNSASRMILYPQKTVIGLLNYQRLYDKYKEAVRQYFTPEQGERGWQIEDREKICCWTPQLERTVQNLHHCLITLDGVLKNFGDYRRSVEDHTRYWDTCYELYTKLSTPLQELKKATPFINK